MTFWYSWAVGARGAKAKGNFSRPVGRAPSASTKTPTRFAPTATVLVPFTVHLWTLYIVYAYRGGRLPPLCGLLGVTRQRYRFDSCNRTGRQNKQKKIMLNCRKLTREFRAVRIIHTMKSGRRKNRRRRYDVDRIATRVRNFTRPSFFCFVVVCFTARGRRHDQICPRDIYDVVVVFNASARSVGGFFYSFPSLRNLNYVIVK